MELLLSLQLLMLAVTPLAHSQQRVNCRAVSGSQGECTETNESRCWAAKYDNMRSTCCPQSECSDCGSLNCDCLSSSDLHWQKQPCMLFSLTPSQSIPPQNLLTLTPSPIQCSLKSFDLALSWPEMSGVDGYGVVVRVPDEILPNISGEIIGNFTTNSPAVTNITFPNVCYSSKKSRIVIELWKYTLGEYVLADNATLHRRNCYTLYGDNHELQRSRCGAKISDQVDISGVTVSTSADSDEYYTALLSWPSISEASSYIVTINTNISSEYRYFSVSNITQVELTGLQTSLGYDVRIQPYIECVGMYYKRNIWSACNITEPISLSLQPNPPSPSLSSAPTSDDDAVSRSQFPYSSSHHLPHSTHTYSFSTPTATEPSLSGSGTLPLTVGLLAVSSLLVPLVLLIACIAYRQYRRRETFGSPLPSPTIPSPTQNSGGYIPYPLPSTQPVTEHKVWVLYSLETPEDQQRVINELLFAGLQQLGLNVETPGTIPSRDIHREWIERGVYEASAVLFVCNDQFYAEWLSDPTSSVGGVRIGRDARMIKNRASPSNLAKFAIIHFEQSELHFHQHYPGMATHFITKYFSMCGDMPAALSSIVSFVKNIPKYELDLSI